jgi:lipopolysaccharide transport system ATP-binding protein
MSNIAIRVENFGKLYRIGQRQQYKTLRDTLTDVLYGPFRAARSLLGDKHAADEASRNYIWALKDVSFEVKHGEVIGIIGRNGAGKSTLLKILSRITEPTEGNAEIHGRVGSLLEVGTGFHPELTGRENIYLNGAILGMKKVEIDRKLDEIVAFSEVERFIDTPVKHYSSGMHVRLAFAVAAQLEPEILLVDEVLAVGDAAFQKKCMGKMREVGRGGRTILFVSHNMGAITELCDRAILLDQGRQVAQGEVNSVLGAYSTLNNKNEPKVYFPDDPSLPCSILELRLCNHEGMETGTFDISEGIIISITYRVKTKLHGLQVTATLSRNMVDIVHSFDTDGLSEIPLREPGLYQAQYRLPKMFLKAGIYTVRITAGTPERLIQDYESAVFFDVEERSGNAYMKGYRRERPGHVISPGTWQTTNLE